MTHRIEHTFASAVDLGVDALAQIRRALGPAAYDRNGILLYEGDSVELLAGLPEGVLDITVTSPPYNIGKEYETSLETAHYLDWCESWIGGIYRATAPNGAFWLNLGYVAL